MFKYSLFICKCSERESHFDCHIDCHFDCNLQLIVNFLSDNMSELKGVRSGAERMKKYRAENKQKCDVVNVCACNIYELFGYHFDSGFEI